MTKTKKERQYTKEEREQREEAENKKKVYDFYTIENIYKHFAREKMTQKEAEEYCQKYHLTYQDVSD